MRNWLEGKQVLLISRKDDKGNDVITVDRMGRMVGHNHQGCYGKPIWLQHIAMNIIRYTRLIPCPYCKEIIVDIELTDAMIPHIANLTDEISDEDREKFVAMLAGEDDTTLQ